MGRVYSAGPGLLGVTGPQLEEGTSHRLLHDNTAGQVGDATVELPIAELTGYLHIERQAKIGAVDPKELWRRRGRFKIDGRIAQENPRLALEALRGVFVTRCEFVHEFRGDGGGGGCFDFIAISEHFEVVPEGRLCPWYDCHVETGDGGVFKVTWHRQKVATDAAG